MEWVIFTEDERQAPAPDFRLPSTLGGYVSREDYRQHKNLVLFFGPAAGCAGCAQLLAGFSAHLPEYEAEATQVIGVCPETLEAIRRLSHALVPALPLLADSDGRVRRAYADVLGVGPDGAFLVALDRYAVPLVGLAGDGLEDPALHRELVRWLLYAEIKCSDCGVTPEWPLSA